MNTSCNKFCEENTSSNGPSLIDINSDVSDWNFMQASIVVNTLSGQTAALRYYQHNKQTKLQMSFIGS